MRLVVAGVPVNKIADAHRGILQPLAQVAGNLSFTLTLEMTSKEGISDATLQSKIKATIRQIGARLVADRTLLLEIMGQEDEQVRAKHEAAKRWVEAVNHWGKLGRWVFRVVYDPDLTGQALGV